MGEITPHLGSNKVVVALSAVMITAALLLPQASGQTFTVLYTFTGAADGRAPYAGLVMDNAGNLYGTTYQGGSPTWCPLGCGTVFKLDTAGNETVLHTFLGSTDGAYPSYGYLLRDLAGNLYATTFDGAAFGNGTAFRISAAGKDLFLPFSGGANGGHPSAGLISDSAGNFYGTTTYRGTGCAPYGCGTVFKISKTGNETVLHSFTGGSDGAFPYDQLLRDSAGNLYGTTQGGGPNDFGTVFEINSSGKEGVLYTFTGFPTDGMLPSAGLIQDTSGNFYGTTFYGGTSGAGIVFKIDKNGTETILYTFCAQINCADGVNPQGTLVLDSSGNLYGTTSAGGDPISSSGTIFKLDPSGSLTVLHTFCPQFQCSDGANPLSGLLLDRSGTLYGTASSGGANNHGTVFKLKLQ